MKKLILFASALCMSVCAMAQSEFYVYKTDGSRVKFTIADVDSISFTAPKAAIENGHEYIDLGLPSGLKWATRNEGAETPEAYGNYYAWGETTAPKDSYYWDTYKWRAGSGNAFTKYNTDSNYGIVDNKTTLDPADDVAAANWGGKWRMPTDAEWTELRENCVWTWTTQNGTKGYKVTSKTNGNSIFLPAAGGWSDDYLSGVGGDGSYWSSSLSTDDPYEAGSVIFTSNVVHGTYELRYCGFSVRPVLGE